MQPMPKRQAIKRNTVMTKSNSSRQLKHYTPATDGKDHINISHNATTELGILLAHFTESHFTHPYLGPFECIEGYWHYVRAATPDDRLRILTGKDAYTYGSALPHIKRRYFRDILMDGNFQKIKENARLRELLVESSLPFAQYYLFGPERIPINQKTAPWLLDDFEDLRDIFQKGDDSEFEITPYEKYLIISGQRETPGDSR
jgi:hypothetical protein